MWGNRCVFQSRAVKHFYSLLLGLSLTEDLPCSDYGQIRGIIAIVIFLWIFHSRFPPKKGNLGPKWIAFILRNFCSWFPFKKFYKSFCLEGIGPHLIATLPYLVRFHALIPAKRRSECDYFSEFSRGFPFKRLQKVFAIKSMHSDHFGDWYMLSISAFVESRP